MAMDLANARVTRRAIDLLEPQPGEIILDAGCGTGAALAEVRRRAPCNLIGIDRSHAMVGAACRRLGKDASLRVGAVEELAPDTAELDGALLLNVLYFCGADAAMVRAVNRRLKPGGRLVAYVTHRATMERWTFARSGLHRLFNPDELAALLTAGGFAPAQIKVHEEPVAHFARGLFAVAHR
jgi:ubiquinone/menaquinone biosynthesis C-methylase UbiE